jgi:hypothetical protein
MKRLAGFHVELVGLAGLVVLALVFSGHARAATLCNGPLSGTVVGGVVVNSGDTCFIAGANISGGVRVNEGGVLFVCSSTINGGLIANRAANLILGAEEIPGCGGDQINGGVKIRNTGPGVLTPAPSIALENSTINGSVHLSGNSGVMAVAANTIAGGLFCSNNAFDLEDEGNPSLVTGAVTCDFTD